MNDAAVATLLVLAVAVALILLLVITERHRREQLKPVHARSQVQHQMIAGQAERNQRDLRALRTQIEEQNRHLEEDAERLEMITDELAVRRRQGHGH